MPPRGVRNQKNDCTPDLTQPASTNNKFYYENCDPVGVQGTPASPLQHYRER